MKTSYGTRSSLRLAAAIIAALGFVLFFGFLNTGSTHAAAGTNPQLNYQGRLLDNTGAVVADGTYNTEFKVYQDGDGCVSGGSSPCSGTLKWTETRIQTNRVTVKNGYFSVNLGSITAFGASVDWNQDTLWLSINIGGVTNTPTPTWDGEMTPFKRLTSTPYALNSSLLGGLQAANFVQLAQGVQTDTSTANASIFVNKNNASGTPNILQLQKSSSDVLVIDNNGGAAFSPGSTADVVVSADADSNFQVNYTSTTDATLDIVHINIIDNASANTGSLYGLAVVNNDNGANTGVPDALAYLNNANAAETVVDGLLVEQTGAGILSNGLEIKRTAGTVTNGLTFTGTIGSEIKLQNAETISNGTNGTIALGADSGAVTLSLSGSAATVSNTGGGLSITGATTLSLASTANNNINISPNGSGDIVISQGAGSQLQLTASAVPTADQLAITNAGQGVTSAGINGLSINYVGGAAAVEAAGERIDVTGGTTAGAGALWSGLRVVQGTVTAGTTVRDIKLETAALTTTSATTAISGLSLATAGAINNATAGSITWKGLDITNANVTQGASGTASASGLAVAIGTLTTGGTQYGLNITGSSTNAAGTETGINISSITGGAATETGLLIGTGWDDAIRANGIVTVGAQADSASTGSAAYSLTNEAAGTYGSGGADTNRDKVASSVVYKGKLFVSTAETNLAGVYRYDGGTHPWTLVTSTTLGKALSTDSAADADAFVMTVFDGKLWIGSQTANATAAVYSSTTADTASAGDNFTLINSARGTINAGTQAGIQDMTVYNGNLIVSTQKTDSAEIDRYEGGTTFTRINATVGKSAAETTADKDAFNLAVCANVLYAGSVSGSTTAILASYQGNGTTWINTTVTLTGGSYGAETNTSDINSLACWNGSLYMATSKTAGNAAAIYYYKATAAPVANVAANFVRLNTAVGKMLAADGAVIDSFTLRTYNGRLYAGSQTAAAEDAGALFEYTGIPLADFTLMSSSARGTFGAQTLVNAISALQEYNGTLYIGTDDGTNNIGSVYTWSKTIQNSYALRFDSGNSNYGTISFVGDRQSADNNGHYGSFLLSNSIQLSSGAFDYAEDYATIDSSLSAGEPVAVDPDNPGYVKRAGKTDTILGVVSKNPGFRLSASAAPEGGGEWLPIALVGRVPVRVSASAAQPISAGDKLSILTPGVLHKAGPGEQIAGVALEGFSGDGVGSVSMFVHPEWSSDGGNAAVQDAGAQGMGLALNAGTDYNPNLFNMLGSDGQSVASIDSLGNATFKGTVSADKIKANQIEGLEVITDKISSLSAQLAKQQSVKTAAASPPVNLNNLTNVQAVSLSVLAQIEAHGGLIVDKDAQFNGKTIFALLAQFNGPAKFNGVVSFNSDAGGTALIKKDAKKVEVKFSKEYATTPIISANYLFNGVDISADQDKQQRLIDSGYSFVISQTSTKGFTIVLNKAATEDISFSWLATLINNPQISQSQPISVSGQ